MNLAVSEVAQLNCFPQLQVLFPVSSGTKGKSLCTVLNKVAYPSTRKVNQSALLFLFLSIFSKNNAALAHTLSLTFNFHFPQLFR